MAVRNPPVWLQAGSYSAENDRLAVQSIWSQEGILAAGDLQTTPVSGMNLSVSAGTCIVKGDNVGTQGSYICRADSATTVTVSTASGVNPRKDIIIAEVLDNAYGIAGDIWQLRVVAGTPAASPVAPTVPNSALLLATVDVPTSASSISAGNIVNNDYYRAYGPSIGPLVINSLIAQPASPWPGMVVIDKTTGFEWYWSGSAWLPLMPQIPHSTIANVVPTANEQFNGTTSYANFPASARLRVTGFIKLRADTKIICRLSNSIEMSLGGFSPDSTWTFAVNLAGSDREVGRRWQRTGDIGQQGFFKEFTGIAAGTYTVEARFKTNTASAGICGAGNCVMLEVTETL